MTAGMILHVCTLDKFIPPFIKLMNEEFSAENHQFWLEKAHELKPKDIEKAENVFNCERSITGQLFSYLALCVMLYRANKIILHGLSSRRVVILLALCPWLLRKCYWVIWGGDLYCYQKPKPRLRNKAMEVLRKFVIKRFGYLVTYIAGDVELAREWYGARGEYHECLMYLSNIVDTQILEEAERTNEKHSGLNILVGNSANPSNNHLEALEMLLPYKDQDISIYVPLSYGDQNHAEKVIEQGKEWFGDKFFPMTSFIAFDQYLAFLKSIDVAIFNHNRQQAMGSTITLLGLGKTIYMRDNVSQWDFLTGIGLKIKSLSNFNLQPLSEIESLDNTTVVHLNFSRDKLINQISKIIRS